jgi:hypothetical protein
LSEKTKPEPLTIEIDIQLSDDRITENEVRLLQSHLSDIIKDVLTQCSQEEE